MGVGAWWCLVRGLGSGQCACRLLARDVLDVLRQRFGRGSGGGENGWTTISYPHLCSTSECDAPTIFPVLPASATVKWLGS
eukprot:scaffold9819_cov181-Isochrysis_galbana.AAC.1